MNSDGDQNLWNEMKTDVIIDMMKLLIQLIKEKIQSHEKMIKDPDMT